MGEVLPTFDRDRVYVTDIKKLISWYNLLVACGMTDFDTEDVPLKKKQKNKFSFHEEKIMQGKWCCRCSFILLDLFAILKCRATADDLRIITWFNIILYLKSGQFRYSRIIHQTFRHHMKLIVWYII